MYREKMATINNFNIPIKISDDELKFLSLVTNNARSCLKSEIWRKKGTHG